MINSLKKNFYENLSLFYAVYFIIFLLFLTTIAPIITTSSATTYWSNYQEKSFASGSGTSSDPYIITTPGQLYYFFNLNKNAYGKLGTSLDLSAHMWDSPEISTGKINLDGDGKSILNLQSNSTFCGLIGKNTNSNSEITFNNLTIKLKYSGSSSSQYGGAFVGYTDGTVNLNKCVADGAITSSFSRYIGGFVGRANYLNATQCLNYVSMNVKDGNVGGICGYVYTSATLKLCGNNGDLSTDKSYAGGLIAFCSSLTVNESFNSGIITASKGYAGGLFGYVSSSSNYTLTDVYNSGKITGNYAGGLIAFSNKQVTLNNAYNSGDVVSQQNITPTKYGMSDEINYVTNKSLKVRGKDVFTNKSSNSGIKVEQYTTGGSEIDYNLNIIYSYNYDMYCADVSFVNNYMNISKKTNCYSVNPNDMTYLSWDSGPTEMNIGVQTQINNTTQQKMLKTFTFDRQEINSNKNLIVFEPKLTTNANGVVNVECDGPEILDVNQTLDYNYTNLSRLILEKYIPYNFNNWQLYGIYVIGVTLIKQGNFFELVPLILFWYEIQESGWENRQPFKIEYVGLKEWGERVISFNVVNPQYYTVSQIKSANLGDNFAVNENINGGMPYLKNFYWQ